MYLFEDNPFGSMAGRLPTREIAAIKQTVPSEPLFNAEEHCVLMLADRDPVRSLARPGRIGRVIDRVFAFERLGPLANPGLETLRRTAIILRTRGRLTTDDARDFYEERYSPAHLEELRRRYGLAPRSAGEE